jgi:membrane associated rhomboid family serine protease
MITGILLALQLFIWVSVYLTGDTATWTPLLLIPAEFSPIALLTAPFVHVSVLHLATNLALLWIVGRPLERSLGALPFLLLYVGSALFAGLMHVAIALLLHADVETPASGASGAIAGLMGAYAIRFSHRPIRLPLMHRPILSVHAVLLTWVALELAQAMATILRHDWVVVGQWAHVGGFVFGLAVAQWMGVGRAAQVERSLGQAQRGELTHERARQALQELLEGGSCSEGEIESLLAAAAPIPGTQSAIEAWLEAMVAAGRLDTALPVYREARRRWPDLSLSAGVRYALGCRLVEQRRWALAVETLAEAGRLDPYPDSAAAALVRAGEVAAGVLHDPQRAIALLSAAIERQPAGEWHDRATAVLGHLTESEPPRHKGHKEGESHR